MQALPHLKLREKLSGIPRLSGGGGPSERTKENQTNRKVHSEKLNSAVRQVRDEWSRHIAEREDLGLAPLEDSVEPIFLQLDPDLVKANDFDLGKFGVEIISEENEGFIIGASLDDLISLEEKINEFAENEWGSGKIAKFWRIIDGDRDAWRPEHILSVELYQSWREIKDDSLYIIEVSIAFTKPIGPRPDSTKKGGHERLERYEEELVRRDDLLMERENHFQKFVSFYSGQLLSSFVHMEDSFGCQISISGKGLKDLVVNYPYVFEVTEREQTEGEVGENEVEINFSFDLMPPVEGAPEIGIIDSGIMQGHKYLEQAIKSGNSKSYIHHDHSVADKVPGGGHGTKVAGAALYPLGVSHISGTYELPFYVRNIKVLDKAAKLVDQYPVELMCRIVNENSDCRIFNLSINSTTTFRKKHMSSWAAMLDKLSHENKVLFIVSAGNIHRDEIVSYLQSGNTYPFYFSNSACKIANPGQSSFSITVGSINNAFHKDENWESLGQENEIAAYSRIGTGIWGHIKPDVVEYGGGMKSTSIMGNVQLKDVGVELIRSTLHGGHAYNRESVGTSFATPKVTHIAGVLEKNYGNENINLIRALIAQGARLPEPFFREPSLQAIEYYGYGIPSIERVVSNTEYRITMYNTGDISSEEGSIFELRIPENLRQPEDEYDILVEVTMAYTAKTRRTRQRTKSYLGTWLEWKSSKLQDSFEDFRDNIFKEVDGEELDKGHPNEGVIQWKIRERSNWGVNGINRNESTLQKDWTILKSHEMPEALRFAIIGHKGWDMLCDPVPYAFVVSVELINQECSIYEMIRIENEVEIET